MTDQQLARILSRSRKLAIAWIILPALLLLAPLWQWPVPSWSELYSVILLFTGAFWLGCVTGSSTVRYIHLRTKSSATMTVHVSYVPYIFGLTVLLNIGTLFSRAAFNPFTCGNVLECSNAAYQAYVADSLSGAGATFEYVRILFSPLIYMGLAAAIWQIAFSKEVANKKWAIAVILSETIISIATGTSRNIANTLLFGLFVYGIGMTMHQGQGRRKIHIGVYFAGIPIILLFFAYFSFLQINREGFVAVAGLLPFNGDYIVAYSATTDNSNFILKGFESVVRYLCTGYFSLSLVLNLSAFGQTFPLGSSIFLAQRVAKDGDTSYITQSLPGQLESAYKWSYLQQWHSIYSWLLSDFSIAGVAVIMVLIGFCFASSLAIAAIEKSPIYKLPLFIFFVLVLYIPANNQIFQAAETSVSFLFSFLLILNWYAHKAFVWRLSRGR